MAELLLFMQFKEKLKADSLPIDTSIQTIEQLRDWLMKEYPIIKEDVANVIWAKNEEYVELDESIEAGDVIAMIAPVSGG